MHFQLAIAIAIIGFIFTSRAWLNTLHTLSPEAGLILKNVIIFSIILILHVMNSEVATPHRQALGVFFIYIAFLMIFNYQSDWIDESDSENVSRQTVDGAVYNRARTTLNLDPDSSRLVTFVVAPFLLVLFGTQLIKNRQLVNLD